MSDYDSIPALNWSTLKLIETSPRLLKFRADMPRKDTDALAFGRAVHCCVLEPAVWTSVYLPQPDFGDMRTKVAKAAKAGWESGLAPSAITLPAGDFALVETCAESIREHREAMKLMVGCRREEVIQWTDKDTGLACKARLDTIRPTDIVDLKSTRHGTVRKFLSDASSMLYHGQLVWYHDGAIAAGVLPDTAELPGIVAVQTTEPYDVMAFRMTREAYLVGQRLWRSLIRKYADCQAADFWPGVAPGLLEFNVMPWAAGGEEREEESW